MNTPSLFVLAASALALSVSAQETKSLAPVPGPAAPPQTGFTVECQMVTIPGKLVPTVVPELNDDAKAAAALQKLLAMIVSGDATLTAHISARGVLGEKTVAESIQEVKYPTEFTPPELPATTPVEPSLEVLKNWPAVGISPTAFETRNVGQTLELEVTHRTEAKVLSCSYAVQHVRFEKTVKFDAGRLANGEHIFIEQPYFSVMRDQSNTIFESGQPKLIGVHRLLGPEGVYELFIMTLRLAPAKVP